MNSKTDYITRAKRDIKLGVVFVTVKHLRSWVSRAIFKLEPYWEFDYVIPENGLCYEGNGFSAGPCTKREDRILRRLLLEFDANELCSTGSTTRSET